LRAFGLQVFARQVAILFRFETFAVGGFLLLNEAIYPDATRTGEQDQYGDKYPGELFGCNGTTLLML